MQARRVFLSTSSAVNSIKRCTSTAVASLIDDNNKSLNLKSYDEIPGPPSLPIIGQLHNFLPGMKLADIDNLQSNLYKLYGPICKLDALLSRPAYLFLYDPEAIEFILRSEDILPIRPGFDSIEYYRKKHNKPKDHELQPTGLVSDHGEIWRYFRTTVNKVMLPPKTIKMYSLLIGEVADDMVERLKTLRNKDNMIEGEFDTEMNLWSLESISVIALGGRLNCFTRELPEDSPEMRLIRCVHEIFKTTNEIDFGLSLWKYFPTKSFKRAMKVFEEQENLAKHFITKARKEIEAKNNSEEEKGVLEKLLEIDERIALIMASDMLLAGVDTTATAAIATLYHLAKNQDKQEKLRKEIVSGDNNKQYLRACIKEAHRIHPVVPGNMRTTTKEYSILGYRIPKGTSILFLHQYLSKMEEYFPRPEEFIPERWIEDGELSYKNAHPFAFSPFGFGVRMCIGRRIAELEIETFVAKVVKNFKLEWIGPPPKVQAMSLNYIRGPFNFKFTDIN